ncbi:MAG: hypothetical protein AAFV80_07265 [Bacteroidota bacterium]
MRPHLNWKIRLLFFGFLGVLFGCGGSETKGPEQAICLECKRLFLLPGEGQHYLQADFGSNQVELESAADQVLWTGTLSTNWDLRKTSNQSASMPWFEVIYSLTGKAWIHGSQINWSHDQNAWLLDSLNQMRQEQELGPPLYRAIRAYEKVLDQSANPVKLADLLLKSEAIKQELVLAKDLNVEVDPNKVDLFGHTWLSSFNLSEPTLFRDFSVFEFIAAESPDNWDNECLSLYYFLFPEDSIEYDINVFDLPLDQQTNASILGQETHITYLKKLERLHKTSSYPQQLDVVNLLKNILIKDLAEKRYFWEEKDLALKEIQQILQFSSTLLNQEQKLEIEVLQNRIQQQDEMNFQLKLGSKADY